MIQKNIHLIIHEIQKAEKIELSTESKNHIERLVYEAVEYETQKLLKKYIKLENEKRYWRNMFLNQEEVR